MAEFVATGEQEVITEGGALAVGPYKLRLSKDGSYKSDLQAIRNAIRANGTRQNLVEIDLTVPPGPWAKVFLDFAFQSNGAMPASDGSLYLLAFKGAVDSQWRFNMTIPDLPVPGIILPMNGSYLSLGYPLPDPLPTITKPNLDNAVQNISRFAGEVNAAIKTDLARVIIAVSEAIRFRDVEVGILSALDGQDYVPNGVQIRNWGGHTLGDYNLLEDQ